MSSNNADFGGLWAPNIYTLEEKSGAKVLCSGKDGGVVVPGALIARGDYAEQNPEHVAKFLAVYLRAWKWMNAHKPEAIAMMKKFYEQGGVVISEASMKKEFDTRPTFDLATQLARMDRARGNSDMDAWFGQIGIFMRGTGAIQSIPQSTDYITDVYMKRVQADAKLREFANRAN
jgi:NitT/TauT family transport system substrate-binding protein